MSAPLRITKPIVRPVARKTGEEYRDFLERLIKLIPSPVISLYLLGRGIVEGEATLLLVWTVVCFVAVIIVHLVYTADPQKGLPPQWPAAFIACISYLVWVYSMGDIFQIYSIYFPKVGSLMVLAWTFVVPYFYRGDPE